jgi:hypothetical protein
MSLNPFSRGCYSTPPPEVFNVERQPQLTGQHTPFLPFQKLENRFVGTPHVLKDNNPIMQFFRREFNVIQRRPVILQ